MPSIQTIDDPASFEALGPEWAALWSKDPSATPFQHPAWLLPWWRHCGGGKLCVLAVRSGGRLAALLPLFEYRGAFFPVGVGVSDYHDLLLDPDDDSPTIAASILTALPGPTELPELRHSSPLLRAPAPSGWKDEVEAMSVCPILRLTEKLERLGGAVPSKRLHDYQRALRAVEALGPGRFERADFATVEDHLDALMRLHGALWRSRGEPGVFGEEKIRRFHSEAAPGLLSAGVARLYSYRLGDALVGAWYGFFAHARAYFYISGFDPAYRRQSLGTLIIGYAIEEAVRAQGVEFDFLRGQEPYKSLWGAEDRPSFRRRLLP